MISIICVLTYAYNFNYTFCLKIRKWPDVFDWSYTCDNKGNVKLCSVKTHTANTSTGNGTRKVQKKNKATSCRIIEF